MLLKHLIYEYNCIFNEPQSFIRPFSSGEYNRFALFSRLYWVLKGRRVFENSDIGSALDPNDIESLVSTGSTEPDSLILIIDEGDLCYHPEWQRCFVSNILHVIDECSNDSFSEPGCRRAIPQIQIVFITNSPFMLSDMLREDIFTLSHDRELKKEYMTFGQNIHMLLAHQFFMKKTIGQAAEEEICWLIRLLANESNKKEKDTTFEQEVGEKYRAYFEAKSYLDRMRIYPPSQLDEFERIFADAAGMEITGMNLERDLFTSYFSEPEEFLSKPMAKFYRDLYKEYREENGD